MLRTFAVSALIAAVAAPALAQTGPTQDERRQLVRYDRDSLEYEAGVEELIQRIERVAGDVCGDRTGPRPLDEHRFVEGCVDATTEQAVADVAHPMLTARYYGVSPEVTIDDGPGK